MALKGQHGVMAAAVIFMAFQGAAMADAGMMASQSQPDSTAFTEGRACLPKKSKIVVVIDVVMEGPQALKNLHEGLTEGDITKTVVATVEVVGTTTQVAGLATGRPEIIGTGKLINESSGLVGIVVEKYREPISEASNGAAWWLYDLTPNPVKESPKFQKAVGWFKGFH